MYFFMQFLYFMESKKRENKWGASRWDNGGLEPGAAKQDGPVKFEVD